MRLHNFRLSTLITAITLLIVAVGAVVFLYLERVHYREVYINQQSINLEKNLQTENLRLVQKIDNLRQEVLFLSRIPATGMRASLDHGYDSRGDSNPAQRENRLNEIFFAFSVSHPDCYLVRYIAVADGGKELVRVENRGGQIDVAQPGKLAMKGGLDYFKEYPDLHEGQIGLSEFDLSSDVGGPPKRTLHAVAPVFTPSGKLFGMVVVNLDVSRLLESATWGLPSGTQVYMANGDGQYLLHPDLQRSFKLEPGSKGEIIADFPFIKTMFDPQAADYLPLQDLATRAGKYAAASRIHFDADHSERFLLLMYHIPDVVVASHLPVPVRDVAAGFAAMLLVSWIALLVLRRTFSPLEQVAAAANKIAAGDQNILLPKIGGGEIGGLTDALDAMLGKLKQREKLLRESEGRYRLLVESSPYCIHEIDLEGRLESINRAGLNMLCVEDAGKIYGTPYLGAVSQQDAGRVGALLHDAITTGTPSYFEFSGAGEVPLYFKSCFIPIKDANGKVLKLMGITEDITERKAAEDMLHFHSNILQSMTEGIYLIRASDGKIVFANPQFERMLGYGSGELLDKHASIVNAPGEKGFEAVSAAAMSELARAGAWSGEVQNIRKDGTTFWCHASVSAFDHPLFGHVWVSVHEDITERKKFEEMRAKMTNSGRFNIAGETAASLTHELSQPLTACNNYLDVCLRRIDERDWGREKLKETLQLAYKQAERAAKIINHFKKQVRRPEREITLFDVNLLVRDVMAFLAGEIKRQGISMHMVLSSLPEVMACREEIRQVLLSLCENAIEAMHSSLQRELYVTTRVVETGHIMVGVSDSGEGILPASMRMLFEPFQTSRKGGLGLSLSICRSIIEKHGGRIWADPEREQGAEFYFTLPIKEHHE